MNKIIKERTIKQLENDKRLSEFFRNYHKKIKKINKKEISENEDITKIPKKKKEKINKKIDIPLVKIERCKHNIII
jgi:phenylacetate-coenzyme A ligase PaaK-like adenylate-forming protein